MRPCQLKIHFVWVELLSFRPTTGQATIDQACHCHKRCMITIETVPIALRQDQGYFQPCKGVFPNPLSLSNWHNALIRRVLPSSMGMLRRVSHLHSKCTLQAWLALSSRCCACSIQQVRPPLPSTQLLGLRQFPMTMS